MSILYYISLSGWVLLALTLFYVQFFGYPKKKREGRKELINEMRANNKKITKKNEYGKMTDEQLDNYILDITNSAQ